MPTTKKMKIFNEEEKIVFVLFLKSFLYTFIFLDMRGFLNSLAVFLASRGSSSSYFTLTVQAGLCDQHCWMHLDEHSQHVKSLTKCWGLNQGGYITIRFCFLKAKHKKVCFEAVNYQ